MQAVIFFALILCFSSVVSFGMDTISDSETLAEEQTLVSSGGRFELGFFTSDENEKYLGIWYHNLHPRIVVWVANRDKPLTESVGYFGVDNGNLKVVDESGKSYWSTYLEKRSNLKAKLMDTGNLVLTNQLGVNLWQSFDLPTDTFISGMKMDLNLKLTSWINQNDPKPGNFTMKLDPIEKNHVIIFRNDYNYWKSGISGDFLTSDKLPSAVEHLLFNTSSKNEMYYNNTITRIVMNSTGEIQFWSLDDNGWSLIWLNPTDRCVIGACGKFSSCNNNDEWACKCLPGFKPESQQNWYNQDFSGGCTRISTCTEKDVFFKLRKMKVDNTETKIYDKSEMECKNRCLRDCECRAYSYATNVTSGRERSPSNSICWIWTEELKNMQEDYSFGNYDLFVRMASSDIEPTVRNCYPCGTNAIPYPLSTGSSCGDPAYSKFRCIDNQGTGKLTFHAANITYNVTSINPTARTFIIQTKESNKCYERIAKNPQPNVSFPFSVTQVISGCDRDALNGKSLGSDIDEIVISWEAAPEPSCNSSSDCKDWPNSTCNVSPDGSRRCLCNANFRWDNLVGLNCTSLNHTTEVGSFFKQFEVSSRRKTPLSLILGVTFASITAFSFVIALIILKYRRRMVKIKETQQNMERNAAVLYGTEKHIKGLIDSEDFEGEDKKGIDVPFFDLDTIIAATDNFSAANKLGRGGFGPVYKGVFPGGREIAVKRMSSVSGQGLEEFKNEVVLIAKLQHRNLVRLLGYCITGHEKILLYEYMPNKSLDLFIFDSELSVLLNWETRFNIILGVARGLLYLHQDSRLRIIHRDLKTSNILLDADMNPKISDFGLARMFEGHQTEGATNRVAGTYGYMSPEYALNGLFSVKSDAFSFGVVVLEIVSGKRTTRAFKPEKGLHILSNAWRLWGEDKALDFMDETLIPSVNNNEFMKCVHVALLCVQEDPADRPNMSNVVVMLSSSEAAAFPTPKQPAFVETKDFSASASSSSKQEISTTWSVESAGGR